MLRRYLTVGVCAKAMEVDTDGETVRDVVIHGGCRGQARVLPALLRGMRLDEAIARLRGVQCRNGTSCADQLGRVLEQERDAIRKAGELGQLLNGEAE